jgi:hypothetical protein
MRNTFTVGLRSSASSNFSLDIKSTVGRLSIELDIDQADLRGGPLAANSWFRSLVCSLTVHGGGAPHGEGVPHGEVGTHGDGGRDIRGRPLCVCLYLNPVGRSRKSSLYIAAMLPYHNVLSSPLKKSGLDRNFH